MPNGGGRDTRRVSNVRRRTVLESLGSVATATLAGCLGDDDSGSEETSDSDSGATNGTDDDETGGESGKTVEFAHPEEVRIDEAFSVELTGIPTKIVEVAVTAVDFDDREWTASATYGVEDGALDLGQAAPVERELDGGLMALLQEARADIERSYFPNWETGDSVRVTVSDGEKTVGKTSVDRTYGDVTWERTDSDEFVGWLSEPPGEESLPGVVVLHGSGGQPARGVAQMLAANGFSALALQYFEWGQREELLPSELVEVPLEFVERGAEWLLNRNRVAGEQVGVWGASKGGELALLVGSRFDTVGPVVSLNGSGFVWEGVGESEISVGSSWAVDGEPLPYVPVLRDRELWGVTEPRELEPAYTASFKDADERTVERATIPIEECTGPVLLVSGGDDRLWNSAEFHGVATERLDEHDREYDHHIYEGAGHAIRYPYLPAANREESELYVNGGTTEGYAEADADYWPRVVETFETLREE